MSCASPFRIYYGFTLVVMSCASPFRIYAHYEETEPRGALDRRLDKEEGDAAYAGSWRLSPPRPGRLASTSRSHCTGTLLSASLPIKRRDEETLTRAYDRHDAHANLHRFDTLRTHYMSGD